MISPSQGVPIGYVAVMLALVASMGGVRALVLPRAKKNVLTFRDYSSSLV